MPPACTRASCRSRAPRRGRPRHSPPSMGATSTTDANPSTTVIQRAHCRRNATQTYKPPINARDATSAATGSLGPAISANPISAHDKAYATPRQISAADSAFSRHGPRTPRVCRTASFGYVLVEFMPVPGCLTFAMHRAAFVSYLCDTREAYAWVMPGCFDAGNISSFQFLRAHGEGDLPEERPIRLSWLQGETPAHDATTLQRSCTRWQALHSLPTRSEPERSKPHGSSCGLLSFNWPTSRFSSCVLSFLTALDFDQARRPDMIDGEVPASSQAVTARIALDEFILPFHFLRVWRDHALIDNTEAFL
jgi:hypothetical protein